MRGEGAFSAGKSSLPPFLGERPSYPLPLSRAIRSRGLPASCLAGKGPFSRQIGTFGCLLFQQTAFLSVRAHPLMGPDRAASSPCRSMPGMPSRPVTGLGGHVSENFSARLPWVPSHPFPPPGCEKMPTVADGKKYLMTDVPPFFLGRFFSSQSGKTGTGAKKNPSRSEKNLTRRPIPDRRNLALSNKAVPWTAGKGRLSLS